MGDSNCAPVFRSALVKPRAKSRGAWAASSVLGLCCWCGPAGRSSTRWAIYNLGLVFSDARPERRGIVVSTAELPDRDALAVVGDLLDEKELPGQFPSIAADNIHSPISTGSSRIMKGTPLWATTMRARCSRRA